MKKISLLLLVFTTTLCISQIRVSVRKPSGNNDIATLIQQKAAENNLGAVHSESAAMRPTAALGGYFLRFENGWVYYNPNTKTVHAIYGDIMKKWGEMGYETGELGFPTSDEKDSDKPDWKRMNSFDRGVIYWNDGQLDVVKNSVVQGISTGKLKTVASYPITHFDIKNSIGINKDIVKRNANSKNKFNNEIARYGKEKVSGDAVCRTEYRKLDVENMTQDIIDEEAIADLRLGGIYDIMEFKKGNTKFVEEERNPITISCTGLKSVKIENPTPENLDDALGNNVLATNFKNRPANVQFYTCKIVNSLKEFELAASLSYRGFIGDVTANLKYNQKSTKNKYLMTYIAPAYTVKVSSGTNYFKDATINSNPNLVILDQITYGAKLLVYFESTYSQTEVEAALQYAGYGVKAAGELNNKTILSETTYNIFLYGSTGAIKTAVNYAELHNTIQQMINEINNNNQVNPLQLGKPISYSLRFLDGNIAATAMNANEIPSQICAPNPDAPMNLAVNLNCVQTSDYGFYGWNDAEILNENGQSIDVKPLFDFGQKANIGSTCNQVQESMNNPFKTVVFENLSKATRDNGTLRLWFWINNGEQGHYCPILGYTQQQYATRGGNHYYVDYKLKDLMIPQKNGNSTSKEIKAKADSGKRTDFTFNYNFVWSK